MVTYAVMEYGSVLYETDDELLAHAWAATATHGHKRVVCQRYKKGKYVLTLLPKSPLGDMKHGYRLENEYFTDYPIYYHHDGAVRWDNPERFPESIRRWAAKLITKIENGGN